MLRAPDPTESPTLLALAVSTGLFAPHEADALLGDVLAKLHSGGLGEGHVVRVWSEGPSSPAQGWVYLAPDPSADRVWELWWIGVAPERHGSGVGDALLRFVEEHVRSEGGRLLLIATSSLPALARARSFYLRRGYARCGLVPDFYAEGDDKVLYVKRVDKPVAASTAPAT